MAMVTMTVILMWSDKAETIITGKHFIYKGSCGLGWNKRGI